MFGRQKRVALSIAAIVWLTLGCASKTIFSDETVVLRSALLKYLTVVSKQSPFNPSIVVEGGIVKIGDRNLLISPVAENVAEKNENHYLGARFDISIDGKSQPQLSHGSVGVGNSPNDATLTAIYEWYTGFGQALFQAVAQVQADLNVANYDVYLSPISIRGERPNFSTGREPKDILRALSSMFPRGDGSLHTIQIILLIGNHKIIDGECRIDGRINVELCETLRDLIWPSSSSLHS